MKNQYFGDVSDYKKYALLRILSGAGEISTGVCWMLTPSDGRTDGQKLRYLEQPGTWRRFDPELFDHLHRCVVVEGARDVHRIEDPVLPRTSFYSRLLEDKADLRQRYFAEMREHFRDADLVFFDPDNGFEVRSKPFGRKDSSKFLYWREFTETYEAGHSVLVYQHFSRVERTRFVEQMAQRMHSETNAPDVYAFVTADVVFLLAPRPEHLEHFSRKVSRVSTVWEKRINVSQPLTDVTVVRTLSTEPPLKTA